MLNFSSIRSPTDSTRHCLALIDRWVCLHKGVAEGQPLSIHSSADGRSRTLICMLLGQLGRANLEGARDQRTTCWTTRVVVTAYSNLVSVL